jgi:hypothetical protein
VKNTAMVARRRGYSTLETLGRLRPVLGEEVLPFMAPSMGMYRSEHWDCALSLSTCGGEDDIIEDSKLVGACRMLLLREKAMGQTVRRFF